MTATAGRGAKRRCAACDAAFYDMMREPVRCPRCGAEYDDKAGNKRLASVPRPWGSRLPKGARATARPAPQPVPEPTAAAGDGGPEFLSDNDDGEDDSEDDDD